MRAAGGGGEGRGEPGRSAKEDQESFGGGGRGEPGMNAKEEQNPLQGKELT